QPGQAASSLYTSQMFAPAPLLRDALYWVPVGFDFAPRTPFCSLPLVPKCQVDILVRCSLPVGNIRILLVIEGTTAADSWHDKEIVVYRRGRGIPFQRMGIPWIIARRLTPTKA